MNNLMEYGFLAKIAERVTLDESNRTYDRSASPNDGTNDPDHPLQLEDVESHARANYDTTPKPDAYFNYPDLGIQRGGWYRRQNGQGSYNIEQGNPAGPYDKKHNYIFDAPAQAMLGQGGNTNTDNFFNYSTGKYEALNNSRYNMGGTDSMRNSLYGMSKKPHVQYDEVTGKNFRPAPGIPNATAFMGLTNKPGEGVFKNPVYSQAREDFNMRNDPNSVIGQSRNAYAQYLKETGGMGGQSFANWKNSPSTSRGSGAPKGKTAPTPDQAFNTHAPASVTP